MIRQLLRFRAVVTLAIKRLMAHPLLTAATTVGLAVAIALILTIPVYSESVAFRVLSTRLIENADNANQPPFSYLVNYIGSWNGAVELEATEPLDTYIRQRGESALGLEITRIVRHFETTNFRLFTADETAYTEENLLDFLTFATTEDFFNNIDVIEGALPAPADPSPDSVIEVLVAQNFADEFGIQPGDHFVAFNSRLDPDDPLQITEVRVSGIWTATDADSEYWFYLPFAFEDALIIPEATYFNRISPYASDEINLAVWYIVTDGTGINTSRVDELVELEHEAEKTIDNLLPGASISKSPGDELRPYQRIVSILTLTLTVFSIPIVALLVVFLMMIVGLIVDRQRNETAVLRSRGTTPFQVVTLASVEALIVGSISLVLGLGLAILFTRLMGSTTSFLNLSYDSAFIVSIPPSLWSTAILALLFTLIIRIIPTLSASRYTIVSYKLSTSRGDLRPLLQRLGIDLLLVVLVGYFFYQTVQQGSLITVEGGVANIDDAYNQPIVFLLPPLTILGITLLALRLLPLLLSIISWVIQLTNNVGLLIVTRQLERTPRTYFLPLLLLITTVGLGIYTASFAHTIDQHLYEQQFYGVSADAAIRLIPMSGLQVTSGGENIGGAYVNISEIREIEGIEQATRLGQYNAKARLTGGSVDSTFFGIDRHEFGAVAFWRLDFASARLGYLLNNLAISRDAVLVSREFMEDRDIDVGDYIDVDVMSAGETVNLTMQVVGSFDYFPRWYPERDVPLFVGNLEYLFEQAQFELSHVIITRIDESFDEETVRQTLLPLGIANIIVEEPFTRIDRELARPERQGLFGLLSIGFVASSLATMIGFLLYAIFSYQKRFVELGILRAMGLPQISMMFSISWELSLLIVSGLVFGLGAGLLTSEMYIPYMQFVSNLSGVVPPYQVVIAWSEIVQIILLFVVTFVIIMIILITILRRMRIFEAVKLGESL